MIGAPGAIRTPDPQIRSLVLYPAELRAPALNGLGPEAGHPYTGSSGLSSGSAEPDRGGKADVEAGAGVERGIAQRAAMRGDQFAGDGEAEPGAAGLG